ncbi:Rieske (2Fe-2S) protein [Solilutibacter silvestris]|uniref:Rieske (2Fe-2S) protein n=1 Tax=Solilutibacter silvestris TaxID=1645665 RepID=UPI001F0BA1F8|nr:Rieske (2Fe-2S) protein [Lysobacter silvestris]
MSDPLITLEHIPDHGFAEASGTVDGDAESLILRRDGTRVAAWFNICPHAGRRLDWAPGEFLLSRTGDLVCAAHGASFSPIDGRCTGGPCLGASLRAVPVVVRDGAVFLRDVSGTSATD